MCAIQVLSILNYHSESIYPSLSNGLSLLLYILDIFSTSYLNAIKNNLLHANNGKLAKLFCNLNDRKYENATSYSSVS